MARFSIAPDLLPPVSSSAQHIVRFRVISEDRNRISDWSPIFLFDSVGQIPFSASTVPILSACPVGGVTQINFAWFGPHIDFHDELDSYPHDVFVKWNSEDYIFFGRVVGNSLTTGARQSPPASSVRFWVQGPSYPSEHGKRDAQNRPVRSSILKIVESDTISF